MENHTEEIAIDIILKTGKYLKKNLGKIKEIKFKDAAVNLVTDIDRKAEEMVLSGLKRYFSDDCFLSEEIGEIKGGSKRKWILDPLDGTTNYAHGFPFYTISLALEDDGRPILGLVLDPERNELFSARQNSGAYLNGERIKVSDISELNKSLLATGFSYKIRVSKDNNISHFKDFLFTSQAVRRAGSASLDLCYVACGRFDGFWELDLNPWDTAAGWLIIEEAGGKVTDLSGKKYNHYLKEVLASNGKIHEKMSQILMHGLTDK
ncbi:MAG: hypothetical protein AMJ78_02290 [Omnitrophica WOR_2 bacterium SM23_29]|nr:MAG: hypothetical protein AMJ78_02290 [Omnitrophica WOR_2 bacterium SM23_29]